MSEELDRIIHLLNLPKLHLALFPLDGSRAIVGSPPKIPFKTSEADPYRALIQWDEDLWGFKFIDSDSNLLEIEVYKIWSYIIQSVGWFSKTYMNFNVIDMVRDDQNPFWCIQANIPQGFFPIMGWWKSTGNPFIEIPSCGDITGIAGSTIDFQNYKAQGSAGVTGTFTTADGKTVLVKKGLIVSII